MNLRDCRTQSERDVITEYRRFRRHKGATDFGAQAAALAEVIKYGGLLSPEFVKEFTDGTRYIDDSGRIGLTPKGRAFVEAEAGIGRDPDEWHYWETCGDYVRSGCGLIRDGLRTGKDRPTTGNVCPTCAHVAEHGARQPVVSTVEREG